MLRVLLGAMLMLALLTAATFGQTLMQDDADGDPVSSQVRLQRALLRYSNVAEQNATLLESWRGQLHERLERLGRQVETWRNARVEAVEPPRDVPAPFATASQRLAPLQTETTSVSEEGVAGSQPSLARDGKPCTLPSLSDASLAERCEALADELRQLARQLRAR